MTQIVRISAGFDRAYLQKSVKSASATFHSGLVPL